MKNKKEVLKEADKKNLFKDLVCPKCEHENSIDWKQQKINMSGVWYQCENCDHLDVIGWDIIQETINESL